MSEDLASTRKCPLDSLASSFGSGLPPPDTAPASEAVPDAGHPSAPQIVRALNATSLSQNAQLPSLDTSSRPPGPIVHIRTPSHQTPSSAGLHVQTNITAPTPQTPTNRHIAQDALSTTTHKDFAFSLGSRAATSQPIPIEHSGLRSNLSAGSMSSYHSLSPGSGSTISSPALAAMTDITPLPSPLLPNESPEVWKRRAGRPGSSGSISSSVRDELLPDQNSDASGSIPTRSSPSKVKKTAYGSLKVAGLEPPSRSSDSSNSQKRSISEFTPEAMHNPRQITVSAQHAPISTGGGEEPQIHREQYLAEQRGLVQPQQSVTSIPGAIPTPPDSNRSVTGSEDGDIENDLLPEYVVRRSGSQKQRRYRTVCSLGKGTFSKVALATSQRVLPSKLFSTCSTLDIDAETVVREARLDPKHLVAIKIVQHGAAGGADEERVELGLKREIEILRTLSHPSLINLQAVDENEKEALLVLNYCAGGDLFDLAHKHRDVLTPPVVQRMFAELVGAVSYLHSQMIVHRDIKLENVLVNISHSALAAIESPFNYPCPILTLTDLGLSRRMEAPPNHLLHTRCGSDGYVAPEILMGMPYDGRLSDAWSLGVVLYALMEGLLPFDDHPPRPGARVRRPAKSQFRIARCDWIWYKFGDHDGEWDDKLGAGWEGARDCVDNLMKKVSRGRWDLNDLAQKPYVRDAIQVEGGLRRPHADVDDAMDEEEG